MCMYNTSNVLSIFFTVCYTAFGEGLSKRRDTYYFCSVHAKKVLILLVFFPSRFLFWLCSITHQKSVAFGCELFVGCMHMRGFFCGVLFAVFSIHSLVSVSPYV